MNYHKVCFDETNETSEDKKKKLKRKSRMKNWASLYTRAMHVNVFYTNCCVLGSLGLIK